MATLDDLAWIRARSCAPPEERRAPRLAGPLFLHGRPPSEQTLPDVLDRRPGRYASSLIALVATTPAGPLYQQIVPCPPLKNICFVPPAHKEDRRYVSSLITLVATTPAGPEVASHTPVMASLMLSAVSRRRGASTGARSSGSLSRRARSRSTRIASVNSQAAATSRLKPR